VVDYLIDDQSEITKDAFTDQVKQIINPPQNHYDKFRYEQSHTSSVVEIMKDALVSIQECLNRRFGAFKARFLNLPLSKQTGKYVPTTTDLIESCFGDFKQFLNANPNMNLTTAVDLTKIDRNKPFEWLRQWDEITQGRIFEVMIIEARLREKERKERQLEISAWKAQAMKEFEEETIRKRIKRLEKKRRNSQNYRNYALTRFRNKFIS